MAHETEVMPHVRRRMLKWSLFCLNHAHDRCVVTMSHRHQGAEFIGLQGDTICLWAMDDNQLGHQERTFLLAGTGHDLPTCMFTYMGTVFWKDLVLHVFELYE